ncbi:dihydroorotate dehydrogenase electron transfer subunit [Paenalkalicoccus suaedae]|uniref:Dihydroorotate dehydrogenase electron transfer subunit n=1 Tax=Paenalkalicoccus suaedae TaxID=2592382 RepID=A0A859FI58_9BACI|nr:dihydroorotate dehydrogenase electron transfer subunit [Paenalkalicoccus suaedae]QKS72342.1 dihydroorotate dehydrogenase electron transfer subunit [Paenalkalicoccus suaedae]
MKAHHLPILANVQVSARYWHMTVDASAIEEPIRPGQFFHIRCGDSLYPFLRRPLSIYRINATTIEFLYLVKGRGTIEMSKLQAGDQLDVVGPLGQGFTIPSDANSILLIGRGVGIATLAALAQEAAIEGVQCTAILSARSRDDLLAADMLSELGATVIKVTEEDNTSDVLQVSALIHELMVKSAISAVYTCGSKRLSLVAQQIIEEYGVFGEIALEEHMGCAMGACFACVCDIRNDQDGVSSVRVCIEGPVFPLEKVVLA